ncbi:MAG: transcription antitermination factor NusB [Clostridia bacterium]|nr:transcription antitermination factor NusB [Clostridia bacterium]
MKTVSRRDARICAVKLIYGFDFQKDADRDAFFDLVCAEGEIPHSDFSKELFFGVCDHVEEIDKAIVDNAKTWRFDRIAKISLAVMRVCAYELLFTDTPAPIAINEAIEIDKIFDSDEAPSFVNGVLNAIARSKPQGGQS